MIDKADSSTPQPFRELNLGDVTLPLWMVPFDQAGTCAGTQTRARIIEEVARGGPTDVFLFSHGWNNNFGRAEHAYERFIAGYHQFVRSHDLPQPPGYRPLLVGFHWPSIDLVLPWERPPKIAGGMEDDDEPMALDAMVAEAKESISPEGAGTLEALAARPELTETEASEFASLLAEAYPDDELDPSAGRPDAEEILDTWSALIDEDLSDGEHEPAGPESFIVAREDRPATAPEAAGRLLRGPRFAPRDILRAFTVYKMKDRAGLVGQRGAGAFLRDCLRASDTPRFHLIGHSYGSRLLLAAVCADSLPRAVSSLLLLEPAVNYLCFAHEVPKTGRPGGFRPALTRVEQPILCTFSANDKALHDFFHLAVRRKSDLGELKIAGALGEVPSVYAALGGWGPGGLDADEARQIPLAKYPTRYELGNVSHRIYALNGKTGITGHSDVINEWTYWALYNQVAP